MLYLNGLFKIVLTTNDFAMRLKVNVAEEVAFSVHTRFRLEWHRESTQRWGRRSMKSCRTIYVLCAMRRHMQEFGYDSFWTCKILPKHGTATSFDHIIHFLYKRQNFDMWRNLTLYPTTETIHSKYIIVDSAANTLLLTTGRDNHNGEAVHNVNRCHLWKACFIFVAKQPMC